MTMRSVGTNIFYSHKPLMSHRYRYTIFTKSSKSFRSLYLFSKTL